jgi:Ca2+-binding EF-hand superfamily protein
MNHHKLFRPLLLAAAAATIAGAAIAAPQAQPADAHPQEHSRHAKIDVNGDGALDRAEAAAHPRLAGKFDELDKNRDGKIDASERPGKGRHGRGGHHGMQPLIEADKDQDGRISRTEAAQVPWLEKVFADVDGNRDGYVVRSELRSYHEKMRPQREAERAKRFDERFAEADLNRDGKLSRVEVSEKMPHLSRSFAFMDEDRDGFLTREDLQHRRR